MPDDNIRLSPSRLFAFAIDYGVIFACGAILFGVTAAVLSPNLAEFDTTRPRIQQHALAFVTLTLPVWLYFTVLETGEPSATLGKRLMKLRVASTGEGGIRFGQVAIRNAIKFAPWEIAHAAIWYVPQRPFLDPMPILNLAACIMSCGIALLFAFSLFIGDGRTPYERLSRTRVVRRASDTSKV